MLHRAEQAVRSLGWQAKALRANGMQDINAAFRGWARERVDAVLITTDPIFENQRDQIVALAARHRVPVIYALREYPLAGG
jgi:putative tryptophan/tyrosine transport system substrate-binding protein